SLLLRRPPRPPPLPYPTLFRSRECAGHPALLCYALGNEIPSTMARWLGRRKIERSLKGLCRVIKEEDPDGLVTYENYPTPEYLRSEEHTPELQSPYDLVCRLLL